MVVLLGLLLRHSDRAQAAAHIAPVAERSATHWGLSRHPLLLLTGMPAAPPKECGANHPHDAPLVARQMTEASQTIDLQEAITAGASSHSDTAEQ